MGPWLARAVLVCVLLAGATDASADDGFLAETGFDFWAADDAQRATASVRWYPTSTIPGSCRFVPGSAANPQFPGVDVTAATAGGFVGLSHAVGRIWPTVTLGVDKPFQDGDTVDLETTGTLGARWFLRDAGLPATPCTWARFAPTGTARRGNPTGPATGCSRACTRPASPPAAWRALGPEALRDGGTIGREIEFLGAGSADDYWGGVALDSFSPHGRTDVGIGLQRVCLDDPTNDLTACGFSGELRGEWHFGVRSGGLGEFSRTWCR